MTKQDKISYAQKCIATDWLCPDDSFNKSENIIFETDKTFFEIITFGANAVIRADKNIVTWCNDCFATTPSKDILDGDNLFLIESKLREYGKKLGGEHTRFMHFEPEKVIKKPQVFTYEWFEKDELQSIYTTTTKFNNALNYEDKREVLSLAAKYKNEIIAIVAVDDNHHGLWQIGIDTVDAYRGKGLATYLVKEMALESERRNQTVFYTTWIPNLASVRTAIKAGFLPVWTGYYAVDT